MKQKARVLRRPNKPSERELQKWAEIIRRKFRIEHPILVRYGPTAKRISGWCSISNKQRVHGMILPLGNEFHIMVSNRLRDLCAVQSVMEHELAHAIAWHPHTARKAGIHGPEFGIAWAAVHRELTGAK